MKKYFKDLAYILTLAFLMGLLVGTFLVWGYAQTSTGFLVNLTASNVIYFNENQSNASQGNWNETFTSPGNRTYWINVQNITVIDAKLNFSGYDIFENRSNSTVGFVTAVSFGQASNIPNSRSICKDGAGKLHIVWRYSTTTLYYANSSDNGTTWGINTNFYGGSSTSVSTKNWASISCDGNNITVGYEDETADDTIIGISTNNGATWTWSNPVMTDVSARVYVERRGQRIYAIFRRESGGTAFFNSTDGGTSWGSIANITGYVEPAMAVDGNGSATDRIYVLAYGTADYDYYFLKSNNSGANWTTPIDIMNPTSLDMDWASITFNGSNIYVSGDAYEDERLYFTNSTDYGDTWTNEVNLINLSNTSSATDYPSSITIDDKGNPVIVFVTNITNQYLDIGYIRHNGTAWSGVTYLTNNTEGNHWVTIPYTYYNDYRIHYLWRSGTPTTYNMRYGYFYWGYPNNSYLDVSGDGDAEWSFSGEFSQTNNQTSNFSSELNSYLSTCSLDSSGNCAVPFVLHSDRPGTMRITGINITSSYNITQLFTQQFSSESKMLNANMTRTTTVNSTSQSSRTNFTTSGFYLNNSGNAPVSCTLNGTSGTISSSTNSCNITLSIIRNGKFGNYTLIFDKGVIFRPMVATNWTQDTSQTMEAGSYPSYIKGKVRGNNSDSVAYQNIIYNSSNLDEEKRPGWECNISSGVLGISANSENWTSDYTMFCNKTGMITKLDAGDEILDPAFNSVKFANSSGWNYNTTWYYWISNISLNNTDELVNYSNIYWQNRLDGADFNYSGNISNGTATTVNFNSIVNASTKYRTGVVNVTEEEVLESATNYENDVNLTAPSGLDTSFRNDYYKSIYVNVTLNSSYTNFDLYWWNGVAWEKKTSVAFYNFTIDTNRNWATFYANISSATEHYSVSSSAPVTVPEAPEGGSGKTKVIITGQNFTIEQPDFNLFGSPGGQLITWITIKNTFSRVATPDFTCVNGNYSIDFCKNVWFGEMEITEGKAQFKVYEIPAGTTSKIPMFLILPEEEGIWTEAFFIKVEIEGQEQLATVTVSVSPFWGVVGQGINWFQGSTVFLNMRIPNSFIVLILSLIIIFLVIIILRELKKYGRK